jgi:hypothetical protein
MISLAMKAINSGQASGFIGLQNVNNPLPSRLLFHLRADSVPEEPRFIQSNMHFTKLLSISILASCAVAIAIVSFDLSIGRFRAKEDSLKTFR